MISATKHSRTRREIISRTLGIAVVLVLAVILYLSTVGFPGWLTDKILARVNSGSVVLNFSLMRLSPLHMQLVLDDVRLYRKKVLGPPAVEARHVILKLDLVAFLKKKFCLRRIRIVDGTVRPKLFSSPDLPRDTSSSEGRKADFVVEIERCVVQGVDVDMLSIDLHVEGAVIRFDNIGGELSHDGMRGDVSGNMIYDDKTRILDAHLLTQFDPRLLKPLMNEWDMGGTVDLVSQFDFGKKLPKYEARFRKLNDGLGDFTLDGKFVMNECSYRGIDMQEARGGVHIELAGPKALVKVDIAELVRKEGKVKTVFTIDLTRRCVTFEGVSRINAPAFFQMVGVFTNECRQFFRFDGPVKIEAKGMVDYGGLTNSDFKGTVEAERMGIGPLSTESCSFNLSMTGFTNTVTNLQGKMHGGKFSGSAVFVIPSNGQSNVSYTVEAKADDVDFKELVDSTGIGEKERKYTGKLGTRVKVAGLMGNGNGRTAVGEGKVWVKEGHVFTLPVFGGLTEFMRKYVPGVDFVLAQTSASADFTVRDGKVSSNEILVEGGIFSFSGKGDYYFDRRLDFNVKIRLLKKKTVLGKVVQFITDPISELFEFTLKGTLDKPVWSSLHL